MYKRVYTDYFFASNYSGRQKLGFLSSGMMVLTSTEKPSFSSGVRFYGIILLIILGVCISPHRGVAAETDVVINEIHYEAALESGQTEFVELHNRAPVTVDLSGWVLSGALDYVLPAGTGIPAGGFVVIAGHPEALKTHFGVEALGPFRGQLPREGGGRVLLRNATADLVDDVAYGIGFPWPTGGDVPKLSIELIRPDLDNGRPGSWRAGGPTPGNVNSVTPTERAAVSYNLPPFIQAVAHTPPEPRSGQDVSITADVTDLDGIARVEMSYQIVAPGNYIRLFDEAYATHWTTVVMRNDGTRGDATADDDVYTAVIPANVQGNRHLVRYRIHAEDNRGTRLTVPYADDPQPNFAYFVYDGVQAWRGAIEPGAAGYKGEVITYDFDEMEAVPVYQLIARLEDVEDAQFIPNSALETGYMGHDWLWYGTMVYNGEVFDHIRFRARGGRHRYDMGKNMWKFNFWRGHRLQGHDDYGNPYPEKWDKLNFSAIIQQSEPGRRLHRGEQGLLESVTYRMFNLVGVEAPFTHYAHFRVIDEVQEMSALNQYEGDFWGLYLAVEQPDGNFLEAHDLPDGNLYKMEEGTGELNNHGEGMPTDKSDLNAFLDAYLNTWPSDDWWRENLNLDKYYSYRSILEAVHHYNVETLKNYYYFNNPETGKWSVHPWDVDQTWGDTMAGDGNEPFRDRVLPREAFNRAYQNRMREVRDLLYNEEQGFWVIDEVAAFVDQPGRSIVEADRAMWDYNPILSSRYVNPRKTRPGEFYQISPGGDFAGMVTVMKAYLSGRARWIDDRILSDEDEIPVAPVIVYTGEPGYPVNGLSFRSSDFDDPWGRYTFGAMQWRIGEVYNPSVPNYEPGTRYIYEVEPVWESEVLTQFTPDIAVPFSALRPNRTYRARARMMNNAGYWGHWSEPIQFTTADPIYSPVAGELIVTELMYHPADGGEYEFIELKNTRATPIYLTQVSFVEGIFYTFPPNTVIEPGEFVVLAKNPALFEALYGFPPTNAVGYDGRLDNGGEDILLVDNRGLIITWFRYDDEAPWPPAADGDGYSLARRLPPDRPELFCSWQRSSSVNGSPGADDPLNVFYSECLRSYIPLVKAN